ncbi:uncharacterized protein [Miscanthus floridulus]|uniref:uncharacterized protein n=1 Tax=Miscanthus floridulus TaxID=154761 RepID=UPI00345AA262
MVLALRAARPARRERVARWARAAWHGTAGAGGTAPARARPGAGDRGRHGAGTAEEARKGGGALSSDGPAQQTSAPPSAPVCCFRCSLLSVPCTCFCSAPVGRSPPPSGCCSAPTVSCPSRCSLPCSRTCRARALLCSRRPIPSAPGCCCAPAVRCPSRSLSPAPASKLVVLPSPAPLSSATSSLPGFCLFSQPLRSRPRRPSAATGGPTPTVPSSASASASPASSPASRAPSARRAAAAAGFLLPIHTHAHARVDLGYKIKKPKLRRGRGRPRNSRIKSYDEAINSKKRIPCSECNELGHIAEHCQEDPTASQKRNRSSSQNESSSQPSIASASGEPFFLHSCEMHGEGEGEEEVLSVGPGTERTEGARTEGRERGRLATLLEIDA